MKLLIVDDEARIRNGLRSAIDWQEVGIEEVNTASNGLEAYELFKNHQYDIVITDVRMPGMDGLELCEKLTQLSSKVHIIILSGYSEFSYAKKAMQLGVTDYELKPVNLETLKQLVSAAIEKHCLIDKEEKFKEQAELVYWTSALQKVLLYEAVPDTAQLEGVSVFFGMNPKHEVVCILAEPDFNPGYAAVVDLSSDITRALSEINFRGVFVICDEKANRKIALLSGQKAELVSNTKALIASLHEKMQYNQSISFGISDWGSLSELHALYKQAELALQHKFYQSHGSVIWYKTIKGITYAHEYKPDYYEELQTYIAQYKQADAAKLLVRLFEGFVAVHCIKAEDIRAVCNDLRRTILQIVQSMHVLSRVEYEESYQCWSDLPEYDTIDGYLTWSLHALNHIFEILGKHNPAENNLLMKRCTEYIQNHFQDELTLSSLAAYINRSPNYLSHLFKVEFGISFSEYVNRVRIGEAKMLLKQTDLLVYEIALNVGFSDYDYFKQVFKKYEGISPSDYRNRVLTRR